MREATTRRIDPGLPEDDPVPVRGLVPLSVRHTPAPEALPESVRKSIRANLLATLRGVNAAYRQLEARQRDLMTALIEAREHGFPPTEIHRIRGEATGLGFAPTEFDDLLHATGWPTE